MTIWGRGQENTVVSYATKLKEPKEGQWDQCSPTQQLWKMFKTSAGKEGKSKNGGAKLPGRG